LPIHSAYFRDQALKALALVRSQKVEESLILCDGVLASKPTEDSVLTAMMHVLRGLGRRTYRT
jgi:N-terminal acetyltransferase B complex non-catalytic subunit